MKKVIKISKVKIQEIVNQQAPDKGTILFVLDCKSIEDSKSFLKAATKVFPLNPPIMAIQVVWDAFTDSLFGGFSDFVDLVSFPNVLFVFLVQDKKMEPMKDEYPKVPKGRHMPRSGKARSFD